MIHDQRRGELLIRGHSITPGYFRDPEETAATIDDDRWLHTGDVAVILPGGSLKIIDRRKNIFKLAQGEYVAPEKIEGVYLQAPLISQMFVFGYSDKTQLVAVVVPDPAVVEAWARQRGKQRSSYGELCKTPELKAAVMKEMETAAKECGLKGFEKVKDIYLESQPFSVENDMLTPTLKIKRHNARKKYEAQIQALYKGLA